MKKQDLKLNSYKIDPNTLQTNIKQLTEIKSQLQTTISYYKLNQDKLIIQNQRLKQQISILQSKIITIPDHSICHTQILQKQKEILLHKSLYENIQVQLLKQQKNNKILIQQYQTKLQNYIIENQNSVDKYQQKIAALNRQLKQSKIALTNKSKKDNNSLINSQVKQQPQPKNNMYQPKKNQILKSQSSNQLAPLANQKNQKTEENIVNSSTNSAKQKQDRQEHQIKKQISSKQPSKQQSNQQKKNSNVGQKEYHTSHEMYENDISKESEPQNFRYFRTTSDLPNDEDEQVFQALIRKLLIQIKSIGISSKQILVLPQVKKMLNNENPQWKDLFNFIKNPPIAQKNNQKVQQSLTFIQNTLKNKYHHVTGKLMVQFILRKLQEYQQLSKINTQQLQISQMTPSEKSPNRKKDEDNKYDNHQDSHQNRPSIQGYLNLQSVQQIYK